MKQVLLRQGAVVVVETPAPLVEAGTLLVQTAFSCISAGTELSGLQASGQPLWRRALKQPAKVAKAAELVASQGLARTWEQVQGKLQAGSPSGYSLAGRIVAVGAGIHD